jgi:hypothetical protein
MHGSNEFRWDYLACMHGFTSIYIYMCIYIYTDVGYNMYIYI